MESEKEPEKERSPDVVRPFRASIVRQDQAAQHVSPMLDAAKASRRPADAQSETARGIDPEAYDESPTALYIYRLRRGDDEHVGVVGDVTTEAFVDGTVRGHEAVQPDRVDALVDHFASAAVRSELVALLHEIGTRGPRCDRREPAQRPADPVHRAGRLGADRVAGLRARGARAVRGAEPRGPLRRRRTPSRRRQPQGLGAR